MISQPTTYVCDDKECTVGNYTGKFTATAIDQNVQGTVEIPFFHNGLPVTKIDNYSFAYIGSITEIIIHANIVIIGNRAFTDCYSLKHINIPVSVKVLGDCSLMYYNSTTHGTSKGITYVTFQGASQIQYIGNELFGYKNHVIIVFQRAPVNVNSIKCHKLVYLYTNHMTILSPTPFSLCGRETFGQCPTLQQGYFSMIHTSLFLVILFFNCF